MKENRILLKSIHDEQLRENKREKRADLQRQIDSIKGQLEVSEKRWRALERYLGIELEEVKYKKK